MQRVAGVDLVVAAGQHEHRADVLDPPRRVAEDVERGVVGPVDVLDHEHGRRLGGELLEQRAEHAVDRLLVGQRGGERAVAPGGGVAQRAERARRHQVVARGEQHARPLGGVAGEGAHQARLADPGLAGHERDRAAARRRVAARRASSTSSVRSRSSSLAGMPPMVPSRAAAVEGRGQLSSAAWPSAIVKRCS